MTLTVAGGLVELKLLDKRITKGTNYVFISYRQGKTLPNGYKDNAELESYLKANYQSINDLIERRNKIKSAIVVSNATTKVTIGDETMTVAEAIERKNSISYDKDLLNSMKQQLANHIRQVDSANRDVENRADAILQSFLAGDKSKASEAEVLRQDYIKSNSAELIDVIDIKKEIAKLEERIDKFEADVDLVLSTSNAITQLSI